MKKQTLYILCGLPFAGKTTVSKMIIDKTQAKYISLDLINAKRGLSQNGERIPQNEWDKSYVIASKELKYLLQKGYSVIYDDTNFSFQKREALRRNTALFNADSIVLFVDTPLSEIMRRISKNKNANARISDRPDDFNFIFTKFEKPNRSEKCITLSSVNYNPIDNISFL